MTLFRSLIGSGSVRGILAVLVCAFSPAMALAGGSVRGHGISVDAWLDDNRVAWE